ncbi:hypothetical protein C9I57_32040 [Trinickia symbiotica]|uniref:Uncharacterized protein n=1 Tax=Trinickia symbiotica TaxID=863227 RepID=A0A2T3XJL5_9BURK|nr:hypothetical protein C9I57_32040 [Trinickia symbiotica]
MLGEALPPTARSGLIVFLHQGMWGWARKLAADAIARSKSISARIPTPAEPFEHQAIVYLLARMAMTINDRRTP